MGLALHGHSLAGEDRLLPRENRGHVPQPPEVNISKFERGTARCIAICRVIWYTDVVIHGQATTVPGWILREMLGADGPRS